MAAILDSLMALPPVTRTYLVLCLATTAAVFVDAVSVLDLYLNLRLALPSWALVGPLATAAVQGGAAGGGVAALGGGVGGAAVAGGGQVWRLLTNFLFYDHFGVNLLFHMFFLVRHSAQLESVHYRGRVADFLYLYLFGAVNLLLLDALLFVYWPTLKIMFLAPPLSFVIVYVWARRNPHVRMSFLGVLNFNAPFLPWVMFGFGVLVSPPSQQHIGAIVDLLGIFVGHTYFFLEDVYPHISGGRRALRTPGILRAICGENDEEEDPFAPAGGPGGRRDPVDRAPRAPQINLEEELAAAARLEQEAPGDAALLERFRRRDREDEDDDDEDADEHQQQQQQQQQQQHENGAGGEPAPPHGARRRLVD